MTSITDTQRFLQTIFPDHAQHAIFAHSKVGGGMAHTRDWQQLDVTRDCYWCIAAFPDDNKTTRSLSRALNVRALVIDDVGTKVPAANVELALGKPTAEVLTSEGNSQWTYRLSKPVAVKDWPAFFSRVEQLIGVPLEGRDAVHLFRLPMGFNTKPTRDGFNVQQGGGDRRVEFDVAEFDTGADPAMSCAAAPPPAGRWNVKSEALRELLELIPNHADIDREGEESWINIGHWAKGLCPAGREVFIDWTLTWQGEPNNPSKHTEESIGHSWDGFGNSGLLSQGGRLRAMAERINPEGFKRWDARWAFDDNPEPPPVTKTRAAAQFHRGEGGKILSTMENAASALNGLGIVCRYDRFHHRATIQQEGEAARRVTDHVVLLLRVEINSAYGKDFGPVHIGDAIMALALLHAFNPVTEMLAEAEMLWDGVQRLDRLGPDYFHSEDTEFARLAFRKTLLAAVRRARRPGCKFDQILVTESPEGWDKSSAWAVLAGAENFSDADILGKDARQVQEELADIWIHEIADLSGLSRADVETVKAFASRVNDRARPAYGRYLIDQPRQSIEVGTTNAEVYLLSSTGNRRFWTVKLLARVEMEKLKQDRQQLWGEAAAAETEGETLVLPERLWAAAGAEQEKRRVVDTWEDELANLAEIEVGGPQGSARIEVRNGEQFISNLSVSEYLSGYRRITLGSGAGRRIAEIMKRLGWERCLVRVESMVVRGYKRMLSVSSVSSVTKKSF